MALSSKGSGNYTGAWHDDAGHCLHVSRRLPHAGPPHAARYARPHAVLTLVQTAEAQTKDGQQRNARGERGPVYTLYGANLAPLGIGFFSYEGRGVSANAGGGP